jgi:hypothetical protein
MLELNSNKLLLVAGNDLSVFDRNSKSLEKVPVFSNGIDTIANSEGFFVVRDLDSHYFKVSAADLKVEKHSLTVKSVGSMLAVD